MAMMLYDQWYRYKCLPAFAIKRIVDLQLMRLLAVPGIVSSPMCIQLTTSPLNDTFMYQWRELSIPLEFRYMFLTGRYLHYTFILWAGDNDGLTEIGEGELCL